MATIEEVQRFLADFHMKLSIWGVYYFDERMKNSQALLDMEMTRIERDVVLRGLHPTDYSEGPLLPALYERMGPPWVFGKHHKKNEIYIKIAMGAFNERTICISFHPAEFPMTYPLKK